MRKKTLVAGHFAAGLLAAVAAVVAMRIVPQEPLPYKPVYDQLTLGEPASDALARFDGLPRRPLTNGYPDTTDWMVLVDGRVDHLHWRYADRCVFESHPAHGRSLYGQVQAGTLDLAVDERGAWAVREKATERVVGHTVQWASGLEIVTLYFDPNGRLVEAAYDRHRPRTVRENVRSVREVVKQRWGF